MRTKVSTLRGRRLLAGLRLDEVAAQVQIDAPRLSKLERGLRPPITWEGIQRLATFYEITAAEIMGGHQPYQPNAVRHYRNTAGLSQTALAKTIHRHRSWVADLEAGRLTPTPKAREALAAILGVQAHILFPRERD